MSNSDSEYEAQAKEQDFNLELRVSLASAYASLEGTKVVTSFAATTYEDLADQQIELLAGTGSPLRPTQQQRIARVESSILASVQKLRDLPEEVFRRADEDKDVNTSPGGT